MLSYISSECINDLHKGGHIGHVKVLEQHKMNNKPSCFVQQVEGASDLHNVAVTVKLRPSLHAVGSENGRCKRIVDRTRNPPFP